MVSSATRASPSSAGLVTHGMLLLLCFLLLPRLLTAVGAPVIINFIHYPLTLFVYLWTVASIRPASLGLHYRLALTLFVMWASAALNSAAPVNVVMDLLILCQPFLIVAIMTNKVWKTREVKLVERLVFLLIVVHVGMAYSQVLNNADTDDVKGLFLNMGAGHHVGGAVGLMAGVYFFANPVGRHWTVRWMFPILAAGVVVISDTKQAILVFWLAALLLFVFRGRDLRRSQFFRRNRKRVFMFLLFFACVGLVSSLAVSGASVDRVWNEWHDGFGAKFSVFSDLESYHFSSLNWLLGLGPGHTISRLGWLYPTYSQMLTPLGGTYTGIADRILYDDTFNYLTNPSTGTSLFARSFSWAGIWGDLGLAGVGAYLLTWAHVWRRYCADPLAKFFVLNLLLFGVVFAWLEEPAYVGLVAVFVSLGWQKSQLRSEHDPGMETSDRGAAMPLSYAHPRRP